MRAIDLCEYIRELTGYWADENGVRIGNPDAQVEGITVCWMATADAMRECARRDCNVLLCHEDAFFPPAYAGGGIDQLSGAVNRARLAAAEAAGVVVIRAHGPLDKFCILDDFGVRLGLGDPVVRDLDRNMRVYEIPARPFGQFLGEVKTSMKLDAVRHWAPEGHVCRRIGLPWGGLGLSINARFVDQLLRYSPDTLVAGESDEYCFYAAQDAGVALIETGHASSENPGLEHFAKHLRAQFPDLHVHFHENPKPYGIA